MQKNYEVTKCITAASLGERNCTNFYGIDNIDGWDYGWKPMRGMRKSAE